jgi:hypothetical protein
MIETYTTTQRASTKTITSMSIALGSTITFDVTHTEAFVATTTAYSTIVTTDVQISTVFSILPASTFVRGSELHEECKSC